MKKFFKWTGIVLGLLFALIIIVALLDDSEYVPEVEYTEEQMDSIRAEAALLAKISQITVIEERIDELEEYTISANNLLANIEANQLKVDEALKGKKVAIKGKVTNIGKDVLGDPYITLGDYNMSSVQCMFDESDIEELAKLSKGQVVLVEGKYKSKTLLNVLVDKSKLIKDVPELKAELKQLRSELN